MGRGKMDEAAAERIRKARGEKDDFARRAAVAARQNQETAREKAANSAGGQMGAFVWGATRGGGSFGQNTGSYTYSAGNSYSSHSSSRRGYVQNAGNSQTDSAQSAARAASANAHAHHAANAYTQDAGNSAGRSRSGYGGKQ